MAIRVRRIPGRLPQPWDRSVIFFANILCLFYGNEEETQVLHDEVGAIESYGSRLIPLINLIYRGPHNILVLERRPEPELLDYFERSLQLALPEMHFIKHSTYLGIENNSADDVRELIEFLREQPAGWYSGYVIDGILEKLAEETGKNVICPSKSSRIGNNKLKLHRHIDEKGLLTFDTEVAQSAEEARAAVTKLKEQGYKQAVIRSEIGASGIGMIKVDTVKPDVDIPDYLFFEGAALVQGWLDESVDGVKRIGSPSVQMFIKDDGIDLHDVTEQILSPESIHEGNIAPPPYINDGDDLFGKILDHTEVSARWLYESGYRGTASVDFHLIERDGKTEMRICEINARVTGATYPAILARHFMPECTWLMRNIRFEPAIPGEKILKDLKDNGLLFEKGKEAGILPFNFNPDDAGKIIKGQFIFLAKDFDSVYNLLEVLKKTESLKGDYDRD